jgi:hypothetical protein
VPDNTAAVVAAATITAAAAAAAAAGKPFVVLGFGSSSYPRFCAAADLMYTLLVSVGGAPLMPAAKADALAGEESVVWPWVQQLAIKMQGKGWLDGRGASDLIGRLPLNGQSAVSGARSCGRSSVGYSHTAQHACRLLHIYRLQSHSTARLSLTAHLSVTVTQHSTPVAYSTSVGYSHTAQHACRLHHICRLQSHNTARLSLAAHLLVTHLSITVAQHICRLNFTQLVTA